MIDVGIFTRTAPWYKFWNPCSGLIGGIVFGSVIMASVAAVVVLSYWALSL